MIHYILIDLFQIHLTASLYLLYYFYYYLFFFSFALYYTIDALFYTDSTINKIYDDKGAYNFIFQLPKIIYSNIICIIINLIIKNLSLSAKNVIAIKSLEAFAKAADGKATKIIIPSEIQSLAGLATSFKEVVSEDQNY